MIDQSYSIVLNVFAVITVIVFIVMTSLQKNVVGDISFAYHKTLLFVFTIVAGYFTYTLGDGDVTRNFYLLPGFGIGDQGLFDIVFTAIPFLSVVIQFLSILWMAVAIGLLPLGHTIVVSETGESDEDLSKQLMTLYRVIYVYPFQILTFLLSLTASLFIWKVLYEYMINNENLGNSKTISGVLEKFRTPKEVTGFYMNEKSV
jgi:hypothetical protein